MARVGSGLYMSPQFSTRLYNITTVQLYSILLSLVPEREEVVVVLRRPARRLQPGQHAVVTVHSHNTVHAGVVAVQVHGCCSEGGEHHTTPHHTTLLLWSCGSW